MIQPITSLYQGASRDVRGCIRLYVPSAPRSAKPEPVICIKSYGSYVWVPLNTLSKADWTSYREKISSMIPLLSSTLRNVETLQMTKRIDEYQKKWHQDYAIKQEKDTMIRSLCKMLTQEQLTQWLKVNNIYNKTVCHFCGQYAPSLIKGKCVHLDCPGMCMQCYKEKNPEGFDVCACCNKKQEQECPICQDTREIDNMVKSDTCSHYVCWKCFGMAAKATHPLESCPLCRSVFWEDVCVDGAMEYNSASDTEQEYDYSDSERSVSSQDDIQADSH